MTIIYDVSVERSGFAYHRTIKVAAKSPMQACEAAERIIATEFFGDDWAKMVHEFFAHRVRETTAANFITA